MEAVKQELRKFVLENYYFNQQGTLDDEESFMERGIIDSTGILELVSFLEERYSIDIAGDELTPENLDSIGRLVRFVCKKISERATPILEVGAAEVNAAYSEGEAL